MKTSTLFKTAAPEWEKAKPAKKTRPKNREEMILHYTPLIKYVAQRLALRLPSHISLDYLISAGSIGLIDAVSKFDEGKGVEFKTYAEFRIRGAMLDELRAMDWVPRSVRHKATSIEKAINSLEKKIGRPGEDEEIAAEMGVSLDDYYRIVKELSGLSPLELEDVPRGLPNLNLDDVAGSLIESEEKDPLHQYQAKELKLILTEAIDELESKERTILTLYYYEELTLKEIGQVLELTESRICQLHTKAILKLRARLRQYLEQGS